MPNPAKAADVDSPELLALLDAITRETPLPSSRTELCLLEIDPHRAHVYWNLEPGLVDPARPLHLRVHDITQAASLDQPDQTYEVEVQGLHGRWYLDFWRDERTFVTEIGQLDKSGCFSVIARSNEIHTPPAPPLAMAAAAPPDPHGRPVLTELPGAGRAEEALVEPIDAPEEAGDFTAVAVVTQSSQPELNQSPAMAAGEAAVAFPDEEEGVECQPVGHFPDAEQLAGTLQENRAALEAFYQAAAAFPAGIEVDETPVPTNPLESMHGNEPVRPPALALEQLMGPSSMESALRNLLSGLEAELHIRGKIPAGHALTLYGRTIQLNEDGSFDVRRKLLPGGWILPLLFEHGQSDQR